METKAGSDRLEYVRSQLNFDGCFSVDSIGYKGSFVQLWRDMRARFIPLGS